MSRNREESNATVMTIADLNNRAGQGRRVISLDEKEDLMMENRCTIFIKNYKYLLQKSGKTQAQFCRDVLADSPSPQLLAGYKKEDKDIPLRTMIRIATAFDKTLEEMTGTLLDGSMERHPVMPNNQSEYEKYCGTYDFVYFSTSEPLGMNHKSTPESLNYAVMTICAAVNEVGSMNYLVYGLFHCTEAERQMLYNYMKGKNLLNSASDVLDSYRKVAESRSAPGQESRVKYLYEGTFRLDSSMAEISMHQVKGSDFVRILMHNRAAKSSEGKRFSGGMAVMTSVSRGEEHMPCTQAGMFSVPKYAMQTEQNPNDRKMVLQSAFAHLSKEKIAEKLYLMPPKVSLEQEAKDLFAYIRMFLPEEDVSTPLTEMSEEDKLYCVESYIEKKLTDIVRRNILSYYKLSLKMDSEAYQMLKTI